MKKIVHGIGAVVLVFCLFAFSSCHSGFSRKDRKLEAALRELDHAIAGRPLAEMNKQARIEALKKTWYTDRSYEGRLAAGEKIVEEYTSYIFDSTLAWISRCRDLAKGRGRIEDVLLADIRHGEVLANAGYYIEAWHVLSEVVEPSTLPSDLLPPYFYALFRLADNISENSLSSEEMLGLQNKEVYIDTLMQLYVPESPEWLLMRVQKYLNEGAFAKARTVNAGLMKKLDRNSHEYAIASYYESVLCDSLHLESERIAYEIASSLADFRNVVKDYASLNLLSKSLTEYDIERSFRYVQTSMEDAVFYNAKLRPWQISRYLLDIQNSYQHRLAGNQRALFAYMWIISILAFFLIIGVVLLFRTRWRLEQYGRNIRELNDRLSTMNADLLRSNEALSESNRIKERYIGLFLSLLSDNIGKIKSFESHVIRQLRFGKSEQLLNEFLASTAVEEETDAFYETFDATFLSMFPGFVEQFNDLLEESARIVLKNDEKLNTELRIYALVRLGIDDSNDIASLLRYSVRTIYNYKVKIRNSARIPRDEFDEMVKKIG